MSTRIIPLTFCFCVWSCMVGCDDNNTERGTTIVPPPEGGMYIGQTDIPEGARETLETAIGRSIAILGDLGVMQGQEGSDQHALEFNVAVAEDLWAQGYIVMVGGVRSIPDARGFYRREAPQRRV